MIFQQQGVDILGCCSDPIGCSSTGVAMVVDPDPHAANYLETARAHGLQIIPIIETHLHQKLM